MGIGLAAPATGPVAEVWFSPDSERIYARTLQNRTFVTLDGEDWSLVPATVVRPSNPDIRVERVPEAGAQVRLAAGHVYALGSNLYSSPDGGRTWIDLTGFNGRSVIGGGMHDLAVSPRDPQVLVVGNDWGVWRSADGGLSWVGLNDALPNLPVRRLGADRRITVAGLGEATLDPVGGWQRVSAIPSDEADRSAIAASLGTPVTALGGGADFWYAGTADGRVLVSADRKKTWAATSLATQGAVERIWADPDNPQIALVAGARIFRTITGGQIWDDITGSLRGAPAHGIAGDVGSGAVYVATDRGVFWSRLDLNALGTPSPWQPVDAGLPAAPARDVQLNASGDEVLVALDGYGVYAHAAPHRAGQVRLVNAADGTSRPAAPGSLYSVRGAQVVEARSGDLEFPVLASSQIQVPFEAAPARMDVNIGTGILPLVVKTVSPAIFVDPDGAPLLLDAETGLMLDGKAGAHAGSRIQILMTGLGRVSPGWLTGLAAPMTNPPVVSANTQAFLNGTPIEVTRATLAPGYVGMYLVEVQLPPVLDSGLEELYVTADGQASNRVRISIEALP